jgi:DNA-binding response OmpR family regulator
MLIIVASGNIFRRELTSYILSEAGYAVSEARDVPSLLATLGDSAPQAMIVDAQLHDDSPGAALPAIGQRSDVPLLWLAAPEQAPLPATDRRPSDQLAWPYRPESLLERLAALLARAEAAMLEGAGRERQAGAPE